MKNNKKEKTQITVSGETVICVPLDLEKQALSISITNNDSLKLATSLLSQLNQINDRISQEKDKVLAPLLEAVKAERARWKPTEAKNTFAIEAIRSEMTRYQTALVQERKIEEDAIALRIKAGKGNITLETAIKKIESLPTIEKETSTEEGSVQFREKKTLKIIDLSLIPEVYWHINDDLLLEDLKKGIVIPGAEIEIVQVPVNYR